MKKGKFPHTRKPLYWRRLRMAEGGSFGATEESAATGVQKANWRDSCTEDWCRPALTSLRLVCSPTGVGGGWELRLWLRRSDPRDRTGVGCVNTA